MYANLLLSSLFSGVAIVLVLHKWRKAVEVVSVTIALFSSFLSIMYAVHGLKETFFGLSLINDSLSKIMLIIVNILGFFILLYSIGYMKHEEGYARYYSLMLLFIGSMNLLILTSNIIVLYLAWELVGLCSALLIAFHWSSPRARKAGIKALVVTRIGDIGLAAAIAIIISRTGSASIPDIISYFETHSSEANLLTGLLLLAAIGKSAQFPLHIWLPDAMEGPTPVSALLHSATMVKAGVYLISRFYPIVLLSPFTVNSMIIVSIATIIISSLCALASNDVKRVLAYSTINNLALMFLALGLGNWLAAQMHLVAHSLFKALLFLSIGTVIQGAGTRNLDELGGMWRMGYVKSGIGFLIGALSLAGIPPLPGFFTKGYIIALLMQRFPGALGALLGFAISTISSMYIFRAFYRTFTGEPKTFAKPFEPGTMTIPILALSTINIFGYPTICYIFASIGGFNIALGELDMLDLIGLVLGTSLAYLTWYKETLSMLTNIFKPFAVIAANDFYIDKAYTTFGSKLIEFSTYAAFKFQPKQRPLYTLYVLGVMLLILILILGVFK